MVAIFEIILLLSATASALVKRDINTVKQDLIYIDGNVTDVKNKANAFAGNQNTYTPIIVSSVNLNTSITQTTNDVLSPTVPNPVTPSDAAVVINYFNSPLIPDIKSALNAFVAKKSLYRPSYTAGVNFQFTQISLNANRLASALISKAPSASKAAASSVQTAINSAFSSASSAFNAP